MASGRGVHLDHAPQQFPSFDEEASVHFPPRWLSLPHDLLRQSNFGLGEFEKCSGITEHSMARLLEITMRGLRIAQAACQNRRVNGVLR